jgi:hypothetical protein
VGTVNKNHQSNIKINIITKENKRWESKQVLLKGNIFLLHA